ncbi:MAG: hypothetical protein HYV04_02830 [Deltaproteobacteria bacterium]|nr:hypothetical protein [Deltaproteobacteria bacterium]
MKLSSLLILIAWTLLTSGASTKAASESPLPNSTSQQVRTDKHKSATKNKPTATQKQPEQGAPTSFQTDLLETLHTMADQQKAAYEQNDASQPSWNSPSVLVQGALFVVGALYTFFAYRQWQAIRTQADIASSTLSEVRRQADIAVEGVVETRKAAEAAKQSADIADKSLRIVERAWLAVVFDQPFQPQARPVTPIYFTVKNTGNTVALLKLKKINAKRWDVSIIPQRQLEPKPTGTLPTIAVIFPGDKLTLEGLVDIPFTQNLIDDTNTGRSIFDVYGYVAYDDVFGIRHVTRFCQVYNPRENDGKGGFDFPREAQPEYNDAD